jgi:hypothetical protein
MMRLERLSNFETWVKMMPRMMLAFTGKRFRELQSILEASLFTVFQFCYACRIYWAIVDFLVQNIFDLLTYLCRFSHPKIFDLILTLSHEVVYMKANLKFRIVNKSYECTHTACALYLGVLQLHSDLTCDACKMCCHFGTVTRKSKFRGLLVLCSYIEQYFKFKSRYTGSSRLQSSLSRLVFFHAL